MIMFSRQAENQGRITMTNYRTCQCGDEGCLQICTKMFIFTFCLSSLVVRTGIRDNQYTITYESDTIQGCGKISSCGQASHIDLFKKAYNARMDDPVSLDHDFSLCFYVTALMEKKSKVALTVLLLDQDSPACLWDIAKEFISKKERLQSVSRILVKKFPGYENYRLIVRLLERPSNETLEQIRSIIRPYIGPCSNFEELDKDESDESKLALYEAFRFVYSELFFSALTYTNNDKKCVVVSDEASFSQAFAKTKREIGFRLSRYFPEMETKIPFHCVIKCPHIQPRHLFKQLAVRLFFPGNRWTDCLSRIEIRMDSGIVMFHSFYYLLKDWELEMAHTVLSNTAESIYQELTGSRTFVTCGVMSTRNDPDPIKAPRPAETPIPVREIESRSNIKPILSKKVAKKRKNRKSKIKPGFAEVESSPATAPSNVEMFKAIGHESEHFAEIGKPSMRPGQMTDLQSRIFDLSDDDFDSLLSSFADRLNASN